MTTYVHPERIAKGQLLWLELEDFPERPMVICRVFATMRGFRAQVEILASDGKLINVDYARLFEEQHP